MTITETAPAKINLFLDIGDLRPDRYHNLTSIMFEVACHDRIYFTNDQQGQELKTAFGSYYFSFTQGAKLTAHQNDPDLGLDQWSIVRALEQYLSLCIQFNQKPKLPFNSIHLERNIPAQAGLGGASSDAAAIFKVISQVDPELTTKLEESLVDIGADVPFSYHGGIALATQRGDVLESLPYTLAKFPMLLVKPDIAVATGRAFGAYDAARLKGEFFAQSDVEEVKQALGAEELGKLRGVARNTFVDLLEIEPRGQISGIISTLYEWDALYANMTGSGPTCFAFFVDEAQRDRAYRNVQMYYGPEVWVESTCALN